MKYIGSKRGIAKYILPIIMQYRKPDARWVEPFVGGGNMIDKVKGDRLGADLNKYVIQALKSIRDNVHELPKNNKEFTEEDYNNLKLNDNYKHKGYAGFSYSFGSKWLGGWSRGKERDYIKETYNSALKQSKLLQGVELINTSYDKIVLQPDDLIYCDPPYEGTTKYKTDSFDHNEFWQWCRDKAKEGHIIFISEYNAPKDFYCVWAKTKVNTIDKDTGSKKGIEKLFVYDKNIYNNSLGLFCH